MTRTMGDAWDFTRIPTSVNIAAVYRNGGGAADPAKVAARFPSSRYVTVWIDINATHPESCQVLDVEQGDAEPDQAPSWVKARARLVHTSLPTLYCNRSTYAELVTCCLKAGLLAGKHYQLWISTLDGTEVMDGHALRTYAGVVACQVEGGPSASWDRSIVYDDRWHPLT